MLLAVGVRRLLLGVAFVLIACGEKSQAERLAPARSWVATLRFAGQQWLGNRVPARFLERSCEAASKTFDGIDSDRPLLDRADALTHDLQHAAERSDRAAAIRALDALAALQRQFPQEAP